MTDPGWTPSGDDSQLLPAPPALPESEAGLLGCILTNGSWAHLVADQLEPEVFSEEAYGGLWSIIQKLVARDAPITFITLLEPTAAHLGWEKKDTAEFLAALLTKAVAPSAGQAKHYAQAIRDVWIRRQLFHAADEIKAQVRAGAMKHSGAEILEAVESKLFALAGQSDSDARGRTFADAMADALEQAHAAAELHEAGRLVGVGSGIGAIDRKLGGWRDTDMIIVASRPGMGKTAFSNRIARAAAEQFLADSPAKPKMVAKFSLEMGADQLALRALCAEARISFEKVRLGHADASNLMALARAKAAMDDFPIWIEDSASVSVGAIRSRARRLKRKQGLGLIIIDYLQLVDVGAEQSKETRGNRVQEVSYITKSLKRMAKDLEVPVLVLAQLNRDLEKREDKRPQLSDLRESGTIEQDADIVAFLYRDAYYLQQKPPAKREKEKEIDYSLRRAEWAASLEKAKDQCEFMIAKNRHGAGGSLALKFLPEMMLFEDDTPGDYTQTDGRKDQLAMELMTVA